MSEDEVRQLSGCVTFEEKWLKVWKAFPNERNVDKHGIGNLVLLDSGTNRAYRNAIFPAKRRDVLINSIGKGIYVPPATEAAFAKSYSPAAAQMRYWSKNDSEAYCEGMKKLFDEFMGKADGGAK